MIPTAQVLYAIALLASYYFTFGVPGLACGVGVVCIWGLVFSSIDRPRAFRRILIYLFVGMILYGLFTPAVQEVREATRRSTCKNNLKLIAIALHNYHETYDSFPPPFLADENGKPMHSWRVLLLPFLDFDAEELYEHYAFNQPWNSPHNSRLLKRMPKYFSCPSQVAPDGKQEHTSYVAIIGSDAAWLNGESRKIRDFKDGGANTILLVECNSPRIPWTAPVDLTLDEAVDVLASDDAEGFGGHRTETFFYESYYGRNVLFMDGLVRFAPFGFDRTLARELLQVDDQRPEAGWEFVANKVNSPQRLKWRNVIGLLAMIVLTVLPLPWVWINPKGKTRNHDELPQNETQQS